MQKLKYTGLSMPAGLANVSAAGVVSNTLTATGTSSQSGSYAITEDVSIFTSAPANSGARLPLAGSPGEGPTQGDVFFITNGDANTMLVYPPAGGKLNFGTANASYSLTTLKTSMWICVDGTNYIGGSLS